MQARFEVYEDKNHEFRWRLVAANDQIVATSGEGYVTKSGAMRARDRVIELMQEVRPDADS